MYNLSRSEVQLRVVLRVTFRRVEFFSDAFDLFRFQGARVAKLSVLLDLLDVLLNEETGVLQSPVRGDTFRLAPRHGCTKDVVSAAFGAKESPVKVETPKQR